MADGLGSFKTAKGCSYRDRAYQRTVKVKFKVNVSDRKMISYKITGRRYETRKILRSHSTVLRPKQIDR